MKREKSKTEEQEKAITVRLPGSVADELERRAELDKRSLSSYAAILLEKSLQEVSTN